MFLIVCPKGKGAILLKFRDFILLFIHRLGKLVIVNYWINEQLMAEHFKGKP